MCPVTGAGCSRRLPRTSVRAALSALLVCAALFLGGADRPQAIAWHYAVQLSGSERARATIELTLREVETRRVCVDMSGASRSVRKVEQVVGEGRSVPLQKDEECWTLVNPALRPVRVRYEYDLAGAADSFDNADYVQRHGEALTFSDEAVLLRPDPLPKLQPSPLIEIEFSVPREVQVTAPWLRIPGPGIRYQFDAAQYDGGSYVTVGKFRSLGLLALKNSRVELYVVGTAKASDETLRTWIEKAAAMSDGFYGHLMPPVVHIVLVPIAGRSSLGIFGTVLRPQRPSVVIYFGGDATELPLHDDWVAPHEIFHIGNPRVRYKIPWLVEGFTTYYQDVLRARAGALTAEEAWSDLWDGVRKYCQPAGTSLQSESARLRQTYHYTRVYWGGACLALLLDVEIRTRSRGQRSLDDVMRELRAQSLRKQLDEAAVIAVLSRATSPALVRRYLQETKSLPVQETLRALGVEVVGPDRVRLRDDAPKSAIRRAMF